MIKKEIIINIKLLLKHLKFKYWKLSVEYLLEKAKNGEKFTPLTISKSINLWIVARRINIHIVNYCRHTRMWFRFKFMSAFDYNNVFNLKTFNCHNLHGLNRLHCINKYKYLNMNIILTKKNTL